MPSVPNRKVKRTRGFGAFGKSLFNRKRLSLLLFLSCALPAAAQTYTWVGGNIASWNDAGNWLPAEVPPEGATILFNSPDSHIILSLGDPYSSTFI